jgi:hypothetical protein
MNKFAGHVANSKGKVRPKGDNDEINPPDPPRPKKGKN